MASHPYRLFWLPKPLENAGLKVEEIKGWQYRGRRDFSTSLDGVLLHHTAGSSVGNIPSLDELIRGRSDLHGPLCNYALGRDGTWYVIAAGTANHAGPGRYMGVHSDGNSHLIGVEAENTGYLHGPHADPWPEVQMDSYRRGVKAILNYAKLPVNKAIGHKEWAPDRKVDPTFDMAEFRHDIGELP